MDVLAASYPTPDPTTTATPVYVDAVGSDIGYGFGVVVFLLAAILVALWAVLVKVGRS